MQALEMEEVEGLVMGTGSRKKLNQSRQKRKNGPGDGFAYVAVQRDFVTYIVGAAMVVIVLLLYVSSQDATAAATTTTDGTTTKPTTTVPNANDLGYQAPTTIAAVTVPATPAPVAAAPLPTNASVTNAPVTNAPVTPPPTDPPVPEGTDTTATDSSASTGSSSGSDLNYYSKFATFKPLLDTPLPDEETSKQLTDKWGKWSFWDGDEDMRPTEEYLSKHPHKDCPGEDLPDDSWQVDAVFVNHYLNDADKLISRAMDAIFAEYGHPREGLEPTQLAERMKQFHWEKVDMADATEPPPQYTKRGNRGNGGWTTKRSEKGLVRRLLHAMMTSDTFTVVMGGHSAAAGEGNHQRQSYMMQFHKIMAPIFARLGVKLITRNVAMGGLGTLQHAMGSAGIYGDEIDLLIWDSGMTEGRDLPAVDLFLRQGLIGGKRVPVIWSSGISFNLLKTMHETADADIGEIGQATDLLPVVESLEQAETIPWAARYMKCADDAVEICSKEPRFCAQCWVDRDDGITPEVSQAEKPKGQVKWHPGWRSHQLLGRNLAMAVLQSLQNAVNLWNDNVAGGPPLADEFWHVTEYYDNIRKKVMNMEKGVGPCYEYEGKLPGRMCNTPMKGLTHYTPRAEKTGINLYVKPTADGYVPLNDRKNVFDGPDPPNPCLDIPDGEIDVYAIVAGRRRLSSEEGVWNATTEQTTQKYLSEATAIKSTTLPSAANRSLETGIVPGKGWQLFAEPPGYCDGTYNSVCNRAEECVLQGHQAGRGAIVGNEYSGWLVVNLKDVKEGIIVLKLHTWHYSNENTITKDWSTVNNEPAQRLRERKLEARSDVQHAMELEEESSSSASEHERRSLGVRSTDTPEQPDTMVFEYAIDGEIKSLPRDEFLEKVQHLQRVVETLTILDDPNFTSEARDVEIAIRMKGCGRTCSFGLSHVYWA